MDFKRKDSLATHASLLERLKDVNDQEGWQQFYTTYRRLIFSFATRHGLNDAEAEEVVQETIITVARNLPAFRYDPARCSFKTWLFKLTLWRVRDQIRKRHSEDVSIHCEPIESNTVESIDNLPGPDAERQATLWEEEWKKHLFEHALQKLRARIDEKQFQIFDLYALQQWPASKVARSLGVGLARVYVNKHRVSKFLRKEIERAEKGGFG